MLKYNDTGVNDVEMIIVAGCVIHLEDYLTASEKEGPRLGTESKFIE